MATAPYGKVMPYSNVPSADSDPRQIECWAFTETALRMMRAQASPEDTEGLLTATRLNWRLWTIIQSNLVNPEAAIPDEIRLNLLSLSNFIDRRSAEIISAPEPAKLDILIRINQQLAGGLMAQPPVAVHPEVVSVSPGPINTSA